MKLEMQQNEFEGKLITFCGLDGCGKTTQIRHLVEWLESNGHKVYLTKQPSDFVRNSEIFRTYMDSPTHDAFDYRALSLLCASDRVQHSNRVISQKLKEGYVVISDRYYYSCLANLIARGFKDDMWIYEIAKSIRKPDVAFFLNVTVDEAIRRVRERSEEKDRYIDIELQKKLHDLYVSIARENGGVVISTLMPEETCFKRVVFEVEKVLNSKLKGENVMNSTKEIINAIITEKRFSDKITADMNLSDDLGFDSLSLVELIVDLEDKFDIVIEESDLDPAQIRTVGQIYTLVDKYAEGRICCTSI